MVFTNHFCAYPLCGPSRASLLTGRRPDTTRVYNNRVWFRDTLPTVGTLPRHFRENGYWTASAGTVFHGGLDDEKAWEEGGKPYRPSSPVHDPAYRDQYRARADRHEPSDEPESTFVDVQTAEQAVAYLEARPREPFFVAAGFVKPHVPLIAPRRFFELYSVDDIPLPLQPPPGAPPMPERAWRRNFDIFIDREIADEEARHAILSYYACTSFMDAQVGVILDAVDRLELWERTIVLYWVDHGFHLGDHGFWSKMTLLDPSVRVPCIVAAPGMGQPGTATRRLTEHVDLWPTLAELCGLPMPEGLEGTSFAPLLLDPDRPWKRAIYSQCRRGDWMGYAARIERWHYVQWGDRSQEELYDMASDPDQLFNRARDADYADPLEEMRQILAAGWSAGRPELR
jgi:uncharacterized sulfatase